MTTQEIADTLVSKLKAGDFFGAYDLFHPEAKHIEPKAPVNANEIKQRTSGCVGRF